MSELLKELHRIVNEAIGAARQLTLKLGEPEPDPLPPAETAPQA